MIKDVKDKETAKKMKEPPMSWLWTSLLFGKTSGKTVNAAYTKRGLLSFW
jgi:hypothetical protein